MLRLTSKTVTGGAAEAFLSRLGPGIGAASSGLSLRPLGGGGDAAARARRPHAHVRARARGDPPEFLRLRLDPKGGKATWRVLFLAVFSY